jgi:putative transposase
VIKMLVQEYPVALVCDVLGCARSSYYYRAGQADDKEVKKAIQMVAGEWPTYGYRRVTAQMHRQGWTVNRKRVGRLMRGLGLQVKDRRKTKKTTDSTHSFPRYPNLVQGLAIVRPDQVWVSDITYIRLRCEFVYLAVIMDVFTRSIRGWALAEGTPEIHHSDQGIQYAATAYVQRLEVVNAQISMAESGAAWQNGHAERLMRTIKEEEVDLSDYEDYTDALSQLRRFLNDVYMHKRIHSALGYLTPVEFEERWRREHKRPPDVN